MEIILRATDTPGRVCQLRELRVNRPVKAARGGQGRAVGGWPVYYASAKLSTASLRLSLELWKTENGPAGEAGPCGGKGWGLVVAAQPALSLGNLPRPRYGAVICPAHERPFKPLANL